MTWDCWASHLLDCQRLGCILPEELAAIFKQTGWVHPLPGAEAEQPSEPSEAALPYT